MAARKRRLYCLGEMTVGSLPAPPNSPDFLTQVSTCLSQVYCRQSAGGKGGVKQAPPGAQEQPGDSVCSPRAASCSQTTAS